MINVLVLLASIAWAGLAALTAVADTKAPTYVLSAATASQDAVRVDAQLQIGGHFHLRHQGEVDKVPMSVVAHLAYEQRLADPASPAALAVRHYHTAQATLKIGKGGVDRSLPDDQRILVARPSDQTVLLFGPHGPLSRETLDLVTLVADPLALAGLLPQRTLAVAATFQPAEAAMQRLLGLDTVAVSEVEGVFVAVERGYAKLRLAGSVHGTVDGAATEVELRVSYLFHLQQRRVVRCNVATREKRAAGPVGPGVEAVTQLQLKLDPLAKPERLSDDVLQSIAKAAADATTDLVYQSTELGLRLQHDRDWFVTSEEDHRLVLRRVQRGDLIGQCNLVKLPADARTREATMAQFQKDIRFSLGKRLERFVSAGDFLSSSGLDCRRLIVHGKIEDVPVEWRYYLLVPREGPRYSLALSIEGQLVSKFGDAERQLVETLQLLEQPSEPSGAPIGIGAPPSPPRTAALNPPAQER